MTKFFIAASVLIALVPGGHTIGISARRGHSKRAASLAGFRENRGWPGFAFPKDPWGLVMDSKADELAEAAAGLAAGPEPELTIQGTPSAGSSFSLATPITTFTFAPVSNSTELAFPTGIVNVSSSVNTTPYTSSSATPSRFSEPSLPQASTITASPLTHNPTLAPTFSNSPSDPTFSNLPSDPTFSDLPSDPTSCDPLPPPTSSDPLPPPTSSDPPPPPTSSDSPPPQPTSSDPPPPQPITQSQASSPSPSQKSFSPSPSPSPAPSPAPAPVTPPQNEGSNPSTPSGDGSGNTSGATSPGDIALYLSTHNAARAAHGASPLTYSQSLAAKAQQWVNGCVFKHSGGTLGPFGENLAAGTGDDYGIKEAIASWTDEASSYEPNNPVPSHFTQVVWKATTEVGCALQNCNGIFDASFGVAHYYVCEYSPQGNVIGDFGANVQA